ncbi:MAG: hypothetical protein ISS01_01790 [Nanoarchaeota archaeon]|nr:hypothetical protein [Nanoarchaeota archaeon]
MGWDFSVYVLNAQYWFGNGMYFEIERAPLMSLMIGFFSIFTWKFAEYLYIILVSSLFFFSSVKLAEVFKVDKLVFYLFSLNAFVLVYGLIEGTDLLALSLLGLFLAYLLKNDWKAGLFLGLACLTRYTFVIFLPLLLFHKKIRSFILSCLSYCLVFVPWFIYNKIVYDNIFYSIASSVALNVVYRDYIQSSIDYMNFVYAWNILIPLIVIGLVYFVWKERIDRKYLLIFGFIALSFYSVYNLKSNIVRYFMIFTIPGALFASYAMKKIKWKTFIVVAFIILTLVSTAFVFSSERFVNEDYEDLGIDDECALKTNLWVTFNYNERIAEVFPRKELVSHYIDEGYYMLFKYNAREPEYMFNESFMSEFPVVYQDEEYILIGEGCVEISSVDESYIDRLNNDLLLAYNYTETDDPCFLLMDGNQICYFVDNLFEKFK